MNLMDILLRISGAIQLLLSPSALSLPGE